MTPLHVLTCVSNPMRWRSRRELARNFQEMCRRAGATLWTVEAAFGDRSFDLTQADDPLDVQVRIRDEMWHKETLLNHLFTRLPADWKYAAWIDADVAFTHPRWAEETVEQLQHYRVVQMFSEAHDLAPDGTTVPNSKVRSFAWSHWNNVPRPEHDDPEHGHYGGKCKGPDPSVAYWHHPGYAWAIRRDAYNQVGGLFDYAVVGEADYLMAKGLFGEAEEVVYPGAHPYYLRAVKIWQDRAKALRQDLGYVPGTIVHHWHGKKAQRHYWTRKKVLVESQFDPTTDVSRDSQGIWQLHDDGTDRFITLRDGLRRYFRSRNEDSIDL
jgi:hypothetical protein